MSNYLESMFQLCKKITKLEISKDLQKQIIKMQNTGEHFSNQSLLLKGIRNESDFYIVLILNELGKNPDTNDNFLRSIEPLKQDEIDVFLVLHNIMEYFYKKSLSSFGHVPEYLMNALNPISKYTFKLPYSTQIDISKVIDLEIFEDVISYWENSEIAFIYSNEIVKYESLLNEIGSEKIIQLLNTLSNDIQKAGFKNVPNSLNDLRGYNEKIQDRDPRGVMRFFYLLYSIKSILDISMDFLAMAFKGIKMGVIDEENTINIKSNFSNSLRYGREFVIFPGLKQDPEVSNLVVISENVYGKKEFGYCIGRTYSFMNESGSTIECKIDVIDNEMNPFRYINALYERQKWE